MLSRMELWPLIVCCNTLTVLIAERSTNIKWLLESKRIKQML